MIYLTNFINNIKRICNNIKYVLCYDLNDVKGLNIDQDIKKHNKRIEEIENYLNPLTKKNVFNEINYPLLKRIEKLEKDIQNVDGCKEERKDSK